MRTPTMTYSEIEHAESLLTWRYRHDELDYDTYASALEDIKVISIKLARIPSQGR